MDLSFADATAEDAATIAGMRTAVGEHLTAKHGRGLWSSAVTERGVLMGIHAHSRVLVARSGGELLGSLRLATKKPWAIDPTYFTAVRRPFHLTDMAVMPDRQGQGIGRRLLEYAAGVARERRLPLIRRLPGPGERGFPRVCRVIGQASCDVGLGESDFPQVQSFIGYGRHDVGPRERGFPPVLRLIGHVRRLIGCGERDFPPIPRGVGHVRLDVGRGERAFPCVTQLIGHAHCLVERDRRLVKWRESDFPCVL